MKGSLFRIMQFGKKSKSNYEQWRGSRVKKLVIVFPGIGYTVDKPLLYYALDVAYELGYQACRKVSYTLRDTVKIHDTAREIREGRSDIYSQVEKQLSDIDWGQYDEVLFVSKSIGTVMATAYANLHKLKKIKHVLYTPLKDTFDFKPENAIAFIGTADGCSAYREIVELSEAVGIAVELYEACNHSLETDKSIDNIERLKNIMEKTRTFLLLD